jgi:lysophospholipase L1-like esterase
LGFDSTGSVPLNIYGEDIIKFRWETPHGAEQDLNNDKILERIVERLDDSSIDFYFIHQPYREELVKKFKYIQQILNSFDKRVQKIIEKYNGNFINLHNRLKLSDKYFADRSHLNDKGSIVVSKTIAKFIDNSI